MGLTITPGYVGSDLILDGTIVNADISASAAIALSKLATSTSSQLASIISDETGTDKLVFNTSPSFITDIRTPKVTTSGATNLVLDTNAGTSTGNITINTGANGNINITPNGTGSVNVSGRLGIKNTAINAGIDSVAGWAYDSTLTGITNPVEIFFKSDGLRMYVSTATVITQYDLSVAWDITTAIAGSTFSMSPIDTSTLGLFISPDGTKMITCGNTGVVIANGSGVASEDRAYYFTLGTPWDVSTATLVSSIRFALGDAGGIPAAMTAPQAVHFNNDGTIMYIQDSTTDAVHQFALSTAYNVGTATWSKQFSVSGQESGPTALRFNSVGTRMYVYGSTGDDINEYRLSIAWDIATAVFYDKFYIGWYETTPTGLVINEAAGVAFTCGSGSDAVLKFRTDRQAIELDPETATGKIDLVGSTRVTDNFYVNGRVVIEGTSNVLGSWTIGNDLAVASNTTLTGDLAVNGGDLTTTATTFNLVNATATTVNFAGAGTAISIGAATGTTTINNTNTVVTGDLSVNGGDITTSAANLVLSTASGINSGTITIATGVNGVISIAPNGTGNINLGDTSSSGLLTTGSLTANLVLSTNGGTTSGTVTITAGANGNITFAPNGTGVVDLGAVTAVKITGGANGNILTTNGSGVLSWSAAPSSMVYPASGIANSTGSAWGTSYSTTGSGTVVALQTQPSFTTDIRTPKVTTASAVNLVLDTNAGTSTGNITINTGINGNIAITPNGTGIVNLGDMTGAGLVTTGTITSNLTLNTNNGTTSGSIVITAGTNGNITLLPNGTGVIDLGAVTAVKITGGANGNVLTTNGSGVLSWGAGGGGGSMVYPASGIANSTGTAWGTSYSTTGSSTVVALGTSPSFITDIRTPKVTTATAVNLVLDTNAGTTTGSITINTGTNGNITLLPNGTGQVLIGSTTAGILNIQGTSTAGTATITTNVTTGAVSLMTGLTTATMTIGSANGGRVAIAFNQASTSTITGAVTIAGGLGVAGAVNAQTKSFIISHPTKPGKLLKHGSLEGPEFGVYVRGKVTGKIIELPDYWLGLVNEDTITVDLTPIGKHQKLYVEKIEDNRVYINNEGLFSSSISCFYTVWGERKDVGSLEIELDE